VVAPTGTVTDVGTVSTCDALSLKLTIAPPTSAASEIVTVHVVLPFEDSVEIVQLSPVTLGGMTVAVPPVAASGSAAAAFDAASWLSRDTVALLAPGANVTVAVATTPFGIVSSV